MNDVRLIDANALTRWLESVLSNANPLDRRARAAFSEVLARVKTMLDIDAVPVVRCRECVFRGQHDLCPMNVRVYMLDEAAYLDCTEDDGFCHKGEKMDGGAE